MCSFKLLYFIIFLLNAYKTNCLISDKRLCVNEDCSAPISLAKTLLRYNSPEHSVLSFKGNEKIKIFSKEAGSRLDLWGAEINGKRGYIPKNLVREYKVLAKATKIVDTEVSIKTEVPVGKLSEEKVVPDIVKHPFEVIDGTTILLDSDAIIPSSTVSPILSTVTSSLNIQKTSSNEVKESDSNWNKPKIAEENKNVDEQEKATENVSPLLEDVSVNAKESSDESIFSTITSWINDDKAPEDDEDSDDEEEEDGEEEEEEDGNESSKKSVIVDDNNKEDETGGFLITSNEEIDVSTDNSTSESANFTITSNENMMKNEESDILADNSAIIHNENLIKRNGINEHSTDDSRIIDKLNENQVDEIAANNSIITPNNNLMNNKEIDDISKQTAVSNKSDISKSTKVEEQRLEEINISKKNEVDPKNNEDISQKNIPEPTLQEAAANEANISITVNTDNVDIGQNHLNSATEVEDTPKEDTFDSTNKLETIQTEKEKVQVENIEATTQLSFDNEEILPLFHAEATTLSSIDVTHPSDIKPEVNLFSSMEPTLFERRPEIVNSINTGYQEDYLNENSAVDVNSPLHTETTYQTEKLVGIESNVEENIVASSSSAEEEETLSEKRPEIVNIINPGYQEDSLNKKTAVDVNLLLDKETNYQTEKFVSIDRNVEENIIASSSSVEEAENYQDLPPSEVEPELSSQKDIPQVDLKSSEIPPMGGWYGNANTNMETSSKINEHAEIPQEGQQNNDIPSDIQFNYLKNNEGVLPNKLIGETQDEGVLIEETVLKADGGGIFDIFFSFFGSNPTTNDPSMESSSPIGNADKLLHENSEQYVHKITEGYCKNKQENCDNLEHNTILDKVALLINSHILLYLVTTAIACIIFLFFYLLIDKSSREAPLIKKINNLEKELLISLKEKEILQDGASDLSKTPTEEVDLLKRRLEETEILKQNLEMQVLSLEQEVESKQELEEQIESLERELETSTEVGMELNKIISEMLNANNGGEKLKENVEQLQRQLSEQKWIINDITKSLSDKTTENTELYRQLEVSNKKSIELQRKLDEMVDQILKIEKERDQQQKTLQEEILIYQQKYRDEVMKEEMLNSEVQILSTQLAEAKRKAELKIKEYQCLKDSLNSIKSFKNDKEAVESILNTTTLKAELEQHKSENEKYSAQLKQAEAAKIAFEKKCQAVIEENNSLLKRYQESDKLKVEANMKLEVLNNYFKKREEELQSEILKYKSIWDAKEGEATSTTERIKLMTEDIENYKSQNETLKQEILSQEIDLKSQISILEKQVHENWVTSRQMERKLEDAKQEAAQLRNRITLRERAVIGERLQNRLQSPIDQNGELTLSPPPIESPTSPLLFGGRDHITKSPPLPGLPPFLPPPPGVPFMPPPLHGMPFMPPPPTMFPGDHRPPPLGRMSSPPPLNSRYSPDTSAFSPYERNSPSPPYDSEYGASPPPISGYSAYSSRDDRRDYKRSIHVSNGRNNKSSLISSGSEHSNDSLDKVNRKHSSKMV